MGDTIRAQRMRYAQAILRSRAASGALLGEGDFADGAHVLVLGEHREDTLCALMHTECLTAESRAPDAAVRERSADLVLVPHLTLRTLGRVVRQAATAARPNARLAMVRSDEPGFDEAAARELRVMGFDPPYRLGEGAQLRLVAKLAGGSWRGPRRGLA